ncbi:glycosyltransferase family 8 protein [Vulcanococcus limneticus]|uniref:glycosyltransferase family 8 protein n=1 Tax=Vulcanococcus limneticus TaxID=2170428 RepID=UPI00398C1978
MRPLKLLLALDEPFEPLAEVAVASFLLHQPLAAVAVCTPAGCSLERLRRLCGLFDTPLQQQVIPADSPLQELPPSVRPYFYCIEAMAGVGSGARHLYVDADTLCISPLDELVQLRLDPARPFAVCSHGRPMPDRQLCLELPSAYHYFNAGVILFDPSPGMQPISASQVVQFYLQHQALCRFREQCALNHLLRQKVVFLPNQYNYLSWMRDRQADSPWHDLKANPMAYTLASIRQSLAIVHFSAGALPSRLPADRLEQPDHYWLQLQAALTQATAASDLPRYGDAPFGASADPQ